MAWAAIPASVAVIAVGLRLGSRPVLAAQTAALVVYGGVAVCALALGPRAGAVVAGSVLVAHAVWDVLHLRRGVVVPRSLAEACIYLDVPLAIAVIALALG